MQAQKPEGLNEEDALPFDFNPIQIPEEQVKKHWDLIQKAIKSMEDSLSSDK